MAVSSQATTEQLHIAQRLLEILSPYGVQTRTDMIERVGRFVHYTSAENGLKNHQHKNNLDAKHQLYDRLQRGPTRI